MSVIFFEVDELAVVGSVLAQSAWGGVSQQCDHAAELLAVYSAANARAYAAKYKETTVPVTKAELWKAIYGQYQKADKAAAWSKASMFRYNAAEAKPTANELNVICTILESVGRALFTK